MSLADMPVDLPAACFPRFLILAPDGANTHQRQAHECSCHANVCAHTCNVERGREGSAAQYAR